MADKSAIEWTDATWNPTVGCSKVSPGCANCYAETLSLRFGFTPKPWLPEHAAENMILKPERLDQPLRWKKPRRIFVNSMSDLFHENIPLEYFAQIWEVMAKAHWHTFQILTKRPERINQTLGPRGIGWYAAEHPVPFPQPNIWLGTSIENSRFTWRADELRNVPAAVRFISAEPLLASLFEKPGPARPGQRYFPSTDFPKMTTPPRKPLDLTGIDWVICGGESGGRESRPMHPDWAREIRDACIRAQCDHFCRGAGCPCECHEANIRPRPAFLFKQWGSWSPDRPDLFGGLSNVERGRRLRSFEPDGTLYDGKGHESWQRSTTMYYHGAGPKSGGRELDGREWNEFPEEKVLF